MFAVAVVARFGNPEEGDNEEPEEAGDKEKDEGTLGVVDTIEGAILNGMNGERKGESAVEIVEKIPTAPFPYNEFARIGEKIWRGI